MNSSMNFFPGPDNSSSPLTNGAGSGSGSMTGGAAKKRASKTGKAELKWYTVEKASEGKLKGRYCSRSGPAAAAKKAASKRLSQKGGSRMTLTVRELGTEREFSYIATREKLDKPSVRTIGGETIKSYYRINVKKA